MLRMVVFYFSKGIQKYVKKTKKSSTYSEACRKEIENKKGSNAVLPFFYLKLLLLMKLTKLLLN